MPVRRRINPSGTKPEHLVFAANDGWLAAAASMRRLDLQLARNVTTFVIREIGPCVKDAKRAAIRFSS